MGILTTIILVIIYISFSSLGKTGKIKGITLLKTYFVYWIFIVLLGCLHLYGLYEISTTIYFIVILGSIGFALGYTLYNHKISTRGYKKHICQSKNKEYVTFRWWFYIFLAAAIFIIIKQVILLLPIILASGMSEARGASAFDDTLALGGGWDILISYFAKPFVTASLIILIVNLFHHRAEIKYLFMIFFLSIIYFLSEGGRTAIMNLFFSFLYLLYLNRHSLSKESKKVIKVGIVIFGFLPILATWERGRDVFYALYTYYCGSLQFFSQALNLRSEIFNDFLYGTASFQGFIKPFTGILNLIGFDKPEVVQEASDFILDAQGAIYDIAPNTPMNYFYTIFGYAYKDGGYIGVFIYILFFGILCKYVDIKQYIKSDSVRWVAIKTSFIYFILYSMAIAPFALYNNGMSIIYIVIITSNLFTIKKVNSKITVKEK